MTTNQSPTRVLKFGIIGLGRAGSGMMQPLSTHPCTELAAVAELKKDARDLFVREHGGKAYDSAEALCADPDIDAIYISTPHQFHAQHAVMAAEHGKHVILEKPISLSLEDAETIIEAVDRTGIKLIIGHTASYNPVVSKMREIIASGELGKLGFVNISAYTPFLYRPRRPEELDTSLGGGIIYNQVPHQVDTVRLLGGGMVRSVRAATGRWDSNRPTEGASAVFLEFEDGAAATMVYNGYDHFDSNEFRIKIGDGLQYQQPQGYAKTRKALGAGAKSQAEETALLAAMGYGGANRTSMGMGPGDMFQGEIGLTIVSCEKGDMRLVADGIVVYDNEGKRDLPLTAGRGQPGRGDVIDEIYEAVVNNKPLVHDARWGLATLEVCQGILQSARERKEIHMSRQVPLREVEGP